MRWIWHYSPPESSWGKHREAGWWGHEQRPIRAGRVTTVFFLTVFTLPAPSRRELMVAHTHCKERSTDFMVLYIFSLRGQSHWHNYISLFYFMQVLTCCDLYVLNETHNCAFTKWLKCCCKSVIWKTEWRDNVMLREYCTDKNCKKVDIILHNAAFFYSLNISVNRDQILDSETCNMKTPGNLKKAWFFVSFIVKNGKRRST